MGSEVVVFEAVEEVRREPAASLPLREVPCMCTTAGKGKAIRAEQAEALEEEEGAWAAARGERRGRWPRDVVVEEAGRRLRPGQTFMKELFCGSLMMTWVAATMFQLPVPQPDDLMDGFVYTKAENQETIMRQLEHDDPWLIVIAWPCGPWYSWSRLQLGRGGTGAQNVARKLEASRGLSSQGRSRSTDSNEGTWC